MANKALFASQSGKLLPKTNALNHEQAPAYALSAEHALAQYAATGCLNATFYASADSQLLDALQMCERVAPEFIARTALYARRRSYMKDLPALLCAVLAVKRPGLLAAVFDRVIDDARMLRNFVQIVRSGVTGRKSLGSLPKRLVEHWFEQRDDEALFRASVGNAPSLADVIKMVHPKPATESRTALYAYIIGRPHNVEHLPQVVREFELFKQGKWESVPDVPFQMLTSLPLERRHWVAIAKRAPWQMTRMNLNTFARHGVFEERYMEKLIARRLATPELIRKAKVLPYQLLSAYRMTDRTVPAQVREALQEALEIALKNVPRIDGQVYICPDISGSMQSPVTGMREGVTTAVRCVDVAALVASALLRKNRSAVVLPFENDVVKVNLNPLDAVLTNAEKLSSLPCGGTNCSAPLSYLNRKKAEGDLIVYVSDNESWIDAPYYGRFGGNRTATLMQWAEFKRRNPRAKLVCIDIQPYNTTQAVEREDILNIGGFSDDVFTLLAEFANGTLHADHWVGVINAENL